MYNNVCVSDCSFYYGSHYSSMGIVLFYLLRLEPFTALHRNLQVLINSGLAISINCYFHCWWFFNYTSSLVDFLGTNLFLSFISCLSLYFSILTHGPKMSLILLVRVVSLTMQIVFFKALRPHIGTAFLIQVMWRS